MRRAEAQRGGDGRVLVRPSGTEPKIRLMIQARDAALAERVIGQLADEVRLAVLTPSLPGGPIPPDPPWGGTTPPTPPRALAGPYELRCETRTRSTPSGRPNRR